MTSSNIFLLGLLGALAPEIVRLYSIRNNPDQFQWSWFYMIVSTFFSGLGGVVALALPATTYWGALYAGISTPVIVNTALRKGVKVARPRLKADRAGVAQRYSKFESFIESL